MIVTILNTLSRVFFLLHFEHKLHKIVSLQQGFSEINVLGEYVCFYPSEVVL